MSKFGSEMVGRTFLSPSGRSFTIVKIEPYPANKISSRYREIHRQPLGVLVAVPYRGTLIPNVTVKGGVVRLTTVEIDGQLYKRPGEISTSLGVVEAFIGYPIAVS